MTARYCTQYLNKRFNFVRNPICTENTEINTKLHKVFLFPADFAEDADLNSATSAKSAGHLLASALSTSLLSIVNFISANLADASEPIRDICEICGTPFSRKPLSTSTLSTVNYSHAILFNLSFS